MWTLGPRDRRYDGAHIQRQRVSVDRRIVFVTPHAVLFGICFDQRDAVFVAAGCPHVAQGFGIDREEATGRAVFGGHVGNRGTVGQWQRIKASAVEFDEFAHYAFFAQHFYDFQHQIGPGGAFHHGTGQLKADNFRNQHRNRLTQHRGFGFDTANAPAKNGHTVNHGGVAVGPDERVRICDFDAVLVRVGPDCLRQIFKVHLVADAGAWGNDAEVVKRFLTPLQEGIAFDVAFIFAVDVHLERAWVAKFVDHNRVVNNQINRV